MSSLMIGGGTSTLWLNQKINLLYESPNMTEFIGTIYEGDLTKYTAIMATFKSSHIENYGAFGDVTLVLKIDGYEHMISMPVRYTNGQVWKMGIAERPIVVLNRGIYMNAHGSIVIGDQPVTAYTGDRLFVPVAVWGIK